MITVKIKTSCSGPNGAFAAGQVVSLVNEVAIDLLNGGLAERVDTLSPATARETAMRPPKSEKRGK